MTFSLSFRGRGWFFGWDFYDAVSDRRIYLAYKRMQRAGVISHERTLEQLPDGGLQYTVSNHANGRSRSQGWRLRGPIEHFEAPW